MTERYYVIVSENEKGNVVRKVNDKYYIFVHGARIWERITPSPERELREIDKQDVNDYISRRDQVYREEYQAALGLAVVAHSGQFDKGGTPYIFHPLIVASRMSRSEDQIAAVLHDVVEDSDITIENIASAGIENCIVSAVQALTKEKNEKYDEYLQRVKQNPIARRVKITDLAHNSQLSRIQNPKDKDIRRVGKYKKAIAYLYREEGIDENGRWLPDTLY